jgi:hypothetical protein
VQPAQARVVDRGRRLPAWDPPGRRIPPRLRARLELGTYGWAVMMIVLGVLGLVVIATRDLPPPPHTWTAVVAALAFLAFGLLAIGADMRDGNRTLRLLRLGVVDAAGVIHDPAHPHDRLTLSDAPGDLVLEEHAVRMRRPMSYAFLLAPLACVAMAAALVVLVVVL